MAIRNEVILLQFSIKIKKKLEFFIKRLELVLTIVVKVKIDSKAFIIYSKQNLLG
jgi:hypothetical protein